MEPQPRARYKIDVALPLDPAREERLLAAAKHSAQFFMGIADVQRALEKVARLLRGEGIPYALIGAMAVAGRARELLLPLLFLPLAIPIVVGGVGASTRAHGHYLAFLGLYDAVFTLLSWAAFEYVVSET